MKPHEIREKTYEEVRNNLLAAEENLKTVKFQLATQQLENHSLLGKSKREVARLKTVLREHELGIHKLVETSRVAEGGSKK